MNDLISLDKINAVDIFNGNELGDLLAKIDKEAKSIIPDLETDKGRKTIASMASKVARTKTYLDGLGKDLVSEWKTKAKAVDSERKKMRDHLDHLKEEVRKPLTDWENTEKQRILKHEEDISEMSMAGTQISEHWMNLSLDAMKDRLKEIEFIDKDWEEYTDRASEVKEAAISRISKAIEKREAYEKEQAELEKLRKEAAVREQKEYEERIAKEAAEKAEREKQEAIAKAEEHAKIQAKAAKRKQEEMQQEIENAKAREIEAKKRAKIEAEQAAQKERERIEQQHKDEEKAAKKREADKKHNAEINNAALNAFKDVGIPEKYAKLTVTAIAKGNIPNVRISY